MNEQSEEAVQPLRLHTRLSIILSLPPHQPPSPLHPSAYVSLVPRCW